MAPGVLTTSTGIATIRGLLRGVLQPVRVFLALPCQWNNFSRPDIGNVLARCSRVVSHDPADTTQLLFISGHRGSSNAVHNNDEQKIYRPYFQLRIIEFLYIGPRFTYGYRSILYVMRVSFQTHVRAFRTLAQNSRRRSAAVGYAPAAIALSFRMYSAIIVCSVVVSLSLCAHGRARIRRLVRVFCDRNCTSVGYTVG